MVDKQQMDEFKAEIMQMLSEQNATQLTKLDEINSNLNHVNDGQASVLVKIDDLKLTTEGLSSRIEEVNSSFSQSLTTLEAKVDGAVANLQEADRRITETVDVKEKFFLDQIDQLKSRISSYDTQLYATKMVLNATQNRFDQQQARMMALEREAHRNFQHGREWNIEIDGIPVNVGDEPGQLQEAALKIFNSINVPVKDFHIDAIHRLNSSYSPKPTIVRFHSRKIVKDIHENSRKLKNIKDLRLNIPGLTDDCKLYIRASQCPYYRTIAYNCRELKRKGRLEKFSTGKDGKISIKIGQNWFKIAHENDLYHHFPNFEGFSFKNPCVIDFDMEDDEE